MAKATAILRGHVLSEWGKLLFRAAGKSEALFDHVIRHLEDADVPGIKWSFEDIGARKGFLGGTKGKIRRSLSIESSNHPLQKHRVGAEDYGTCLSVSRYLTVADVKHMPDPDFMNIFEMENLVIYNTVAQTAVVSAVQDLMNELGQDSSDINTESKGYLEVW